jgi:5'-3' exonuclease
LHVLEGYPKARHEISSAYKATRVLAESDPKYTERHLFNEEIRNATRAMVSMLPITTVRHPHWEADDTIFNLARDLHDDNEVIVSSSDSDFVQLRQRFDSVKLWNHSKKVWVEAPTEYDYVTWKSLRGDGCDNVIGIKGIGDKRAAKLASDSKLMEEFLSGDGARREIFERNVKLITFHEFDESESAQVERVEGHLDAPGMKEWFMSIGAPSMVNEPYWTRFIDTFKRLER